MKNLFFAILFASSAAFAVQSNFTLTPKPGQSEFDASVLYNTYKATGVYGKNLNGFPYTEYAGNRDFLDLKYIYGISDLVSVGFDLDYKTSNIKYTFGPNIDATINYKGFLNPSLFATGNYDYAGVTLFYLAQYSFKLENAKLNADTMSGNEAQGQSSVDLNLGVATEVSSFILGGIVDLGQAFSGTETDTSSGHDVDVNLPHYGYVNWILYAEMANSFHPNVAFILNPAPVGLWTLQFTGRYEIAPDVELRPLLAYTKPAHNSDYGANTYNEYQIGLGARLLF